MRAAALTLVSVFAFAALDQDDPAVLMKQHHWKRVRAIANARLKTSPDDPEGNYLMSKVWLAWNDAGKALPYAEKAVSLAPQNADYHWALANAVGDEAQHANVFRQVGLAKRFRSETETALKLDPKHIDARFGMMTYYLIAPGIVGGDKKKAYAEAEEIAKIDRAKGFMAQVRLAQQEKQTDRLEDLYKKALEADPKLPDPYVALLNMAAVAGKAADVERYSRELKTIEPQRTSGYSGLAWFFARQKQWSDLDAVLSEAEAAIPDDFNPYYVAANMLLSTKEDLPRAERYLRKYLSQEREAGTPSHPVAEWRLGLVLEQQGRKPEAVASIEAAVKADPNLDQAKKDLKRLKGS